MIGFGKHRVAGETGDFIDSLASLEATSVMNVCLTYIRGLSVTLVLLWPTVELTARLTYPSFRRVWLGT